MPGSILFPTEVSMYDTEKAFYRHYEYIQKENSLYSRWFQKRGLSYPQFLILDAVLRRPEGAEPTALAEECFMPKQTVTGLLDQHWDSSIDLLRQLSIGLRAEDRASTCVGVDQSEVVAG